MTDGGHDWARDPGGDDEFLRSRWRRRPGRHGVGVVLLGSEGQVRHSLRWRCGLCGGLKDLPRCSAGPSPWATAWVWTPAGGRQASCGEALALLVMED